MLIEDKNLAGFQKRYTIGSLGSATAARRMINDDFRTLWYAYEHYESALAAGAVGSELIRWHHTIGSTLEELSNWTLYRLDGELRSQLRLDLSTDPDPRQTVRVAMAPLRDLATKIVAEAQTRLGDVPRIDDVPLLDWTWLRTVAVEGRESEKTGYRKTIGDIGVSFATMRLNVDKVRVALDSANDRTAASAMDVAASAARRCRAIRVATAIYDLRASVTIGSGDEVKQCLQSLEQALAITLDEGRAIMEASPK